MYTINLLIHHRNIKKIWKKKREKTPSLTCLTNPFIQKPKTRILSLTTQIHHYYCLIQYHFYIGGAEEFSIETNETICHHLPDYPEIEALIERDVVTLERLSLVIQTLPKILICLLLGTWSDRYSCRKWLMVLSNIGFVILPIIQLFCVRFANDADYLLLEAIQVNYYIV